MFLASQDALEVMRVTYLLTESLTESLTEWALASGPEGYPRVLDYSIFFSLLVPYSKNFLLARVVE